MKKTILFGLAALGLSLAGFSSSANAADKLDMKPKTELTPEMKTGKRVSVKRKWDQAQKEAKEKGLLVLVVFTDTDYCPGCKKLDKEVFSKSDFKNNAGAYCVVLEYTSVHTKNKDDKDMLESRKRFNCNGLPGVCLVDADGKVVATLGYGSNPFYMLEYLKRGYDKSKGLNAN